MRRASGLLLLVATLGACETSNLDGSAAVVVSGRVLAADGSPAGGVPVGLKREASLGGLVGGALFAPLTLLTACLADPPPEICRSRFFRRATTAADGSYTFALKGSDTQEFFGNVSTMSVSAELRPGAGEQAGAAVAADFKVQTADLRLPDLQLWQPRVTVAPGRIAWEPLAGAGTYRVGVEDAAAQPVWSFDGRGAEVTFDPRILEDTAGGVSVSVDERASAEGTGVSILRRSARVGYRSAAGPAPSRGRPCTLPPAATTTGRCPLTDGDFSKDVPRSTTTTTASPAPRSAASPEAATIDLGRAMTVSLVVVRGCSCEVEQSADGQAWTTIGRSSGYSAVVPSRTGAARFVRVTGQLLFLREVSVWEGPAPPAPAPASGGTLAAGPVAESPPPSRTAPALVALALLVLAGAGAGAIVARRR